MRTRQQSPGQPHRLPAARRGARPRTRFSFLVEVCKVTVVARRDDGGADVGSTRPSDASAALESDVQRSCELVRDEKRRSGSVDPAQLAVVAKAAEHAIPLREEPLDRLQLRRRGAADDDLAPHRREPVQLHETLVDTSAGASAGAMIPAASRSRSTILVNRSGGARARALRLCRLGTCARVTPIPPRNVSAASDARTLLARRARRRAAACRLSSTPSGSRSQGKSCAKRRLRSLHSSPHGEWPRAQSAAWTTGSTTRSTSSPSTSNGSLTRPPTSRPRVSLSTGWRFRAVARDWHRVRSGAGSCSARRRRVRGRLATPEPVDRGLHLAPSAAVRKPSAGVPPLALARPLVSERSRQRGVRACLRHLLRRPPRRQVLHRRRDAAIAAGRVLVGAHYPTDILASLGVSVVVAYLVVRFARPLLDRGVLLLERITDPVVAPVHNWWQRRSLPAR